MGIIGLPRLSKRVMPREAVAVARPEYVKALQSRNIEDAVLEVLCHAGKVKHD